jgi:hypothetical protein
MRGINVNRWLLGGTVAGVVIWMVEGAASFIYMGDMSAALDTHGLSMEMTPVSVSITLLVSLIMGWAAVFLYAAARPRLGPGPKTALVIGTVLWAATYLTSILGYVLIGLYPNGMLAIWAAAGAVEMFLGALVGAWIYREA